MPHEGMICTGGRSQQPPKVVRHPSLAPIRRPTGFELALSARTGHQWPDYEEHG
jgi:hypothetical protein